MKAMKAYTIPFVGLKVGKHHFDYQIDNTFFLEFDYNEFNAANLNVDLLFEKKTTLLELTFTATGIVNVNCDVTNEPFDLHVEDSFKLVVKFGEDYNDDNEEILIVPHGEYQINVAQYIYELIVLALPAKKVHPGIEDGTLKSDILTKLEELSPKENKTKEDNIEETDPRWDTLKKLLTDK
ncbi:uncharacterized metal-binding protein YceD (DUF177 family) [Winogradskyella wandonensis]|uniref:Uncharacterized metal-binding protein YceD (DUF177 family) n=1 Tax=Winogradskyella wandonensis TaxID=1442586 RepID=A0A4R1KUG0_9FLAO|nr:DUF177 domain-containing protein [Winogradskyella wandonensis]TCK67869.1 uncharacterized metal-binding protein YceD (DUF177 family) [Winogradskyella wandonensis]